MKEETATDRDRRVIVLCDRLAAAGIAAHKVIAFKAAALEASDVEFDAMEGEMNTVAIKAQYGPRAARVAPYAPNRKQKRAQQAMSRRKK